MASSECWVRGCGNVSHDCGVKLTGLSFHCFPAWRTNEGGYISELTRRRRKAWLSAVGRTDLTFDHIPPFARVCSRHFISGRPAFEVLDSDPDWVPSLHLGQNEKEPPSQSKDGIVDEDDGQTDEPVAGQRPSAADLRSIWREAAILLKGYKPNQSQAEDQNSNFRDFFRNSLEASLEASVMSRTQSKKSSGSAEYEVELNLRLPPKNIEPASSCQSCIRLQTRVRELEKKLFQQTVQQQDRDLLHSSVELESAAHRGAEDARDSPNEMSFEVIERDSESNSEFVSWLPPSGSSTPSTKKQTYPRFRTEWLDEFSFLRYSQSQNVMWCHVCRSFATDSHHQKLGLIRGTRIFKKHYLKTHSQSNYHKANMKHFKWTCSP